MNESVERCACGRPLHYTNPDTERAVRRLVLLRGPLVVVKVAGTQHGYRVPRHYIALHGLDAAELDALAVNFGWAPE